MTDFDRSAGPPPPDQASVFLQQGLGIALTFLLHVVVGAALFGFVAMVSGTPGAVRETASMLASVWMVALGAVQLLYVLPVAWALSHVRRPVALGVVIGAALTFALQGACYGLFAVAALVVMGVNAAV